MVQRDWLVDLLPIAEDQSVEPLERDVTLVTDAYARVLTHDARSLEHYVRGTVLLAVPYQGCAYRPKHSQPVVLGGGANSSCSTRAR